MKCLFFLSFIMLFSASGCDLLTNSKEDSSETSKKVVDGGIEYSVSVQKNVFSLRDTLVVTFNVKNNTLMSKTFNFSNVQQLGFKMTDRSNRTVISYPMIVSPALSNFIVHPGETKTLTVNSLLKNSHGNYISAGTYILTTFLLDRNSPEISLRITVK